MDAPLVRSRSALTVRVTFADVIVAPELLSIVLVEPPLKSIPNPVPVLVIEPLFISVSPSSNRTVLEELTAVITPPILLFTDNPVDVLLEFIARPLVALSVPELLIVPPEGL